MYQLKLSRFQPCGQTHLSIPMAMPELQNFYLCQTNAREDSLSTQQSFPQIYHVGQQYPVLIYRMIVIVGEKSFHHMGADETAAFIEADCRRRIAGADLQDPVALPVGILDESEHCSAISQAPAIRSYSDILDLQHALPIVSSHADALEAIVVDGIHSSPVQISGDHVLLLVRHEQERKELELAFRDLTDFHSETASFCAWRPSGEKARAMVSLKDRGTLAYIGAICPMMPPFVEFRR